MKPIVFIRWPIQQQNSPPQIKPIHHASSRVFQRGLGNAVNACFIAGGNCGLVDLETLQPIVKKL